MLGGLTCTKQELWPLLRLIYISEQKIFIFAEICDPQVFTKYFIGVYSLFMVSGLYWMWKGVCTQKSFKMPNA